MSENEMNNRKEYPECALSQPTNNNLSQLNQMGAVYAGPPINPMTMVGAVKDSRMTTGISAPPFANSDIGKSSNTKICTICGCANSEKSKFCIDCGAQF